MIRSRLLRGDGFRGIGRVGAPAGIRGAPGGLFVMRRSFLLALTLIAALLGAASEAPAQTAAGAKARGSSRAPAPAVAAQGAPATEAALGERMNANTVAIVSGTPGGTYFRMASDMAFVLDDGDDLRILPILGKGAGQNAYDIRFSRGSTSASCAPTR